MDMRRIVAVLAEEAEQQILDQVWELVPSECALAREVEAGLRDVVGRRTSRRRWRRSSGWNICGRRLLSWRSPSRVRTAAWPGSFPAL
ncbi:hypothetical protein ACFQ8S_15890 [Streptomyces virginiae]|uniref:hypothetical protein n=1 Tax=Streptomyces virginiae TaxID=1961 RepID=UPI0036AFE12E